MFACSTNLVLFHFTLFRTRRNGICKLKILAERCLLGTAFSFLAQYQIPFYVALVIFVSCIPLWRVIINICLKLFSCFNQPPVPAWYCWKRTFELASQGHWMTILKISTKLGKMAIFLYIQVVVG